MSTDTHDEADTRYRRLRERIRRLDEELERLYSREAMSVMSKEAWHQRNDEVLSAIFLWE